MGLEPQRPRSWGRARWADTRRCAQVWRTIGASEFAVRMMMFGMWDPPTRPFTQGQVLPVVPQTTIDLELQRKSWRRDAL